MGISPQREDIELVIAEDGSIPASDLASLGLRPGVHLRVVPDLLEEDPPKRKKKSVAGIGEGKVDPADILTWEDFEAGHRANVAAAEARYGRID
ncbi:MAG: hypothetical protein ACREN8_03360 [Candidatus Dormibacteraceae bacterium]